MRASWHLIDSTEMFGENTAPVTEAANEDQSLERENTCDRDIKSSEIEAA